MIKRKLPTQLDTAIIKAVHNWIEGGKGRSLGQAANALNVSPTTLSLCLNKKYEGDVKKLETKLVNWLALQTEKQQSLKTSTPFVNTSNSKEIFNYLRAAHVEGEILVITADAGLGKTVTLKQYAKKHADVILIEADLGCTPKRLFGELSETLGLSSQHQVQDLFYNVCDKIKGSGRMVIIDEAEHLAYRTLELVRRMHDKTTVDDEPTIAVALCGMPALYYNLKGKNHQYRQLYSRVGYILQLASISEADSKLIIDAAMEAPNGTYKVMHQLAKGNARHLAKLIARTRRVAKASGVKVSSEVVVKASKLLIT